MNIFTLTLSPIPVPLLSKTGQFFYDLNILSSEKSWWYQGTQIGPIQVRIRRAQQVKTLASLTEINRLYGLLSVRFNRFFDPRGGGKEPFARN